MAGKEDRKSVVWVFDSKTGMMCVDTVTSKKAELEARFSFKLEVYKDSETHVESMKITNFKDGSENGSITTSIVDLPQDIKKFKRFGVVIGDTYFRDLASDIAKHYLDIQVSTVSFARNDERFNDLIRQVTDFITGLEGYITERFCYIPVNEFNGLAVDCGYSDYEMRTLREQLVQSGFIHKDEKSGRYTKIQRIKKDKPERVIAFDREKLEVAMPEKQDKQKKAKGDGDE